MNIMNEEETAMHEIKQDVLTLVGTGGPIGPKTRVLEDALDKYCSIR